jgi:hypothetical protein
MKLGRKQGIGPKIVGQWLAGRHIRARRRIQVWMALSILATPALAGCTAAPSSQPIDQQALASVHKIVVVTPLEPAVYELRWNTSYVQPLERLTAEALLPNGQPMPHNNTVESFKANLRLENVVLGPGLAENVAEALRKKGYDAVVVTADRTSAGAFLGAPLSVKDKPEAAGADAVLDLVLPRAGYAHAIHHYYNPAIRLDARLTDLKSGQTLMRRTYYYVDRIAIRSSDHEIQVDPGYEFKDGGALVGDPKLAATGLRSGLPRFADAIATDMKP